MSDSSVGATISALNSKAGARPPHMSKSERRINYLMRGGSNDRGRTTRNVYFFKAGDKYFDGVRLPINTRRYRTMDALLDELSVKIPGLQYGARGLYTAKGQRRVKSLDHLEHLGSYVASDSLKRSKVEPVEPKYSTNFMEFQRRRDERIAAMRERSISNMAALMLPQKDKKQTKKSPKRKKGTAKRSKSLGAKKSGNSAVAVGAAVASSTELASSRHNSFNDGDHYGSINSDERNENDPYAGFEPPTNEADDAVYADMPERQNATLDSEDMKSSSFETPPGEDVSDGEAGGNQGDENEPKSAEEGSGGEGENSENDSSRERSRRNSRRVSTAAPRRKDSRRESADIESDKSEGGSRRGSAADANEGDEGEPEELAPLDNRKLMHVQRRRLISKETSKEIERDLASAEGSVEDRMSRLSIRDKSGKSSRKSSMNTDNESNGGRDNSAKDSGRSSGSEPITENDRRRESTRSELSRSEAGPDDRSSKAPSRTSGVDSGTVPNSPANQRRRRLSQRRATGASSMLTDVEQVGEPLVVEAEIHDNEPVEKSTSSRQKMRRSRNMTDSGISIRD